MEKKSKKEEFHPIKHTNSYTMYECVKIASTIPNKSVSELIDYAKKIHDFLNKYDGD
jgi:hypothetical protein